MRREDFYDEEPYPGPEEADEPRWNIAPAIQALSAQIASYGHGFPAPPPSRRHGKSNHQVQIMVDMGFTVKQAEQAFDRLAGEVSKLGIVAADLNITQPPPDAPSPVYMPPAHSMTPRRGFDRRGRKTT